METRPLNKIKRASLWGAAAAIIAEAGVKNMMMTTLISVGTPATATGFVYEIVQMRHSRLEREAADRANFAARNAAPPDETVIADTAPQSVKIANGDPASVTDLPRKLESMRIAREQFVQTYGADPGAIAPASQQIANQMLAEDERVFAKLESERKVDPVAFSIRYRGEESNLRRLHATVKMITPASPEALNDQP